MKISLFTVWILSGCFLLQSAIAKSNNTATIADNNLQLGEAFLIENQKKPGVYKLPSGLQYKIIKEGAGTPPGLTDYVAVNYRGTLLDGTEFDSSYAHHTPVTLAVNSTIPGWSEALQLMKPGSKWVLYVPAKLAYGKEGAGRLIGPNATLIFEIELLSVKTDLDQDKSNVMGDFEDE